MAIFRKLKTDWKVYKNRLDEQNIRQRMDQLGLEEHYKTDYMEMCEWAHLMSKVLALQAGEEGFKDFGIKVASYCLSSISNLIDSICAGVGFQMDIEAEKLIIDFQKNLGLNV